MKHKLIGRNKTCNNNYRNKFVIALTAVFLLCIHEQVLCSASAVVDHDERGSSLEVDVPHKNNFVEKCEQRCKDQVNKIIKEIS